MRKTQTFFELAEVDQERIEKVLSYLKAQGGGLVKVTRHSLAKAWVLNKLDEFEAAIEKKEGNDDTNNPAGS